MTPITRPPRIFAGVLLSIGLVLAVGGTQLAFLGGSLYYVFAGIVLSATAIMLWRGERRGAWTYASLLIGTTIWSVVEVGFDWWALAPRLAMFYVLGLWLLLPRTRRRLSGGEAIKPLLSLTSFRIGLIGLVGVVAVGLFLSRSPAPLEIARSNVTNSDTSEWRHYGRTAAGTRFAPYTEIKADNVAQLKKVWTFRTKVDFDFKATPLQVGDSLYVCAAGNIVIAIDAENGTERWRFDPHVNTNTIGFTKSCRGVSYYKSPSTLDHCNERILTATTDARMFAVDANDGKLCTDFGAHENKAGEITLLSGMGEVVPGYYYVTSPPTIARDVAVLGGWVLDNDRVQEPSGVVRAFDPITGKLRWAWDMGRPDSHGLPSEGETYTRGTPNAWSLFSADDELGLVYIPTGNATPDYYGGHRTAAAEKYASSIVALDVSTGSVRWAFQTTHHDMWDYDVPSQPVLTTVPNKQGVATPAVIVPTKRGELFVFDRRDGTPLIDIEERDVPQGAVPTDWTNKTQPFAVGMPSFGGATLREADAWGLTPIDQMLCRLDFRKLRYEGVFTPQSLQGTLQYPGFGGGMNWGSVSVHEDDHLLVVQSLHLAGKIKLTRREDAGEKPFTGFGGLQLGTPYVANSMPWLSPIFTPCQRPPYGEMAVVDLISKRVVWQRPLGTANELGPLGLGVKLALPMGVPYSAGNIETRSGLIFVGGTMDRYLRAIDIYSGRELWRDYLPSQAQATPMSFIGSKNHKQYVVIAVAASQASPLAHGSDAAGPAPSTEGGYIIGYSL